MSNPVAHNKPHGFYPFIHILRGVAPLIVVWSHLAMLFVVANGINWQGAKIWEAYFVKPLHLYQNAGHMGVVIFFFVSGFIITHSSLSENRSEFAVKRILRIFPILAVALASAALARWIASVFGLGNLIGTNPGNFFTYVQAFFFWDMVSAKQQQTLSVTWSLVSEVLFYAMTLVLLNSTKKSPEKATYWMILAWAAVEMLLAGIPPYTYLHFFTIYLGLLIMGRILYLADTGIVSWRKSIPMLLLIALLFTLFHSNVLPGHMFGSTPEPGVTYILGAFVFLCCMTYATTKVPRILAFIADISLSLYLLHIPVGMLVISATFRATGSFSLSLIIGVAASILAAYLGFRFVEMPCQRLARRINKGPTAKKTD